MVEGTLMGTQVLKMIGYIDSLEKLGFPLGVELVTDVILQSLPNSFSQFFLNFNMNENKKILPQLLYMLQTAESSMKKVGPKPILMVCKDKGKGKGKGKEKAKAKAKVKPKKEQAVLKHKGGIARKENVSIVVRSNNGRRTALPI
ncbi:uncharacterized protein [Gossypium hirsutum]|uniref:Uncharacterized protein n=1 Tax=Gossypium hirsutum TaxID=3635 RepID=A0A1U8P995_GOSHI|nr:uncharacterized protein LOC107956751 [Gossypium hirsutum]